MVVSPAWLQVVLVTFLIGFAILGYLAYRIYEDHPPIPGTVVSDMTSETDLAPTVSNALSVRWPRWVDGRSWRPLLNGSPHVGPVAWRTGVLSESLGTTRPGDPDYQLIGGYRWVLFMTEDVQAKYKEWSERGVRFLSPPETPSWGGTYARFEDPDGNTFGLEAFDEVRQSLELRRREQAEKLEAEKAAIEAKKRKSERTPETALAELIAVVADLDDDAQEQVLDAIADRRRSRPVGRRVPPCPGPWARAAPHR